MRLLRPNETFANYVILQHLGRGPYGDVYRARERTNSLGALSADVAIKIPYGNNVDRNAVLREGRIWVACSQHPNIARLIKADCFGDTFYLVSEFLDGGTLRSRLGQNPGKPRLSQRDAILISEGILRALEHLHVPRAIHGYAQPQAVVHRDLKPENILFQGDVPKVSDFGVTRAFRRSSQLVPGESTAVYRAPEAFRNETEARSDIWSAGIILYEMLAGRVPFAATRGSELVRAIQAQEPPALPPCVPEQLRKIVARSLSKPLSERYISARAMREALEIAREDLGGSLRKQPQCAVSSQACCMTRYSEVPTPVGPQAKATGFAQTEALDKAPLKRMPESPIQPAGARAAARIVEPLDTGLQSKNPNPGLLKHSLPLTERDPGSDIAAVVSLPVVRPPAYDPLAPAPAARVPLLQRKGWRSALTVVSLAILGAGGYFGKTAWDTLQSNLRKGNLLADDAYSKAQQAESLSTLLRQGSLITIREQHEAESQVRRLCNDSLAEAQNALRLNSRSLNAQKASALAYMLRKDAGDDVKKKQAIADGLALQPQDALLNELQKQDVSR